MRDSEEFLRRARDRALAAEGLSDEEIKLLMKCFGYETENADRILLEEWRSRLTEDPVTVGRYEVGIAVYDLLTLRELTELLQRLQIHVLSVSGLPVGVVDPVFDWVEHLTYKDTRIGGPCGPVAEFFQLLAATGRDNSAVRELIFDGIGGTLDAIHCSFPNLRELSVLGADDVKVSSLAWAADDLRSLRLDRMGGEFSAAGLRSLERLTKLCFLSLSNYPNEIHPLSDLGDWSLRSPSIKYLAVSDSVISLRAAERIRHLASLTYLDLSNTIMDDYTSRCIFAPGCTGPVPRIVQLHVSGSNWLNRDTWQSIARNLGSTLEYLHIAACGLYSSELVLDTYYFTCLRLIDVCHNKFMTPQDLLYLEKRIPTLKRITAHGTFPKTKTAGTKIFCGYPAQCDHVSHVHHFQSTEAYDQRWYDYPYGPRSTNGSAGAAGAPEENDYLDDDDKENAPKSVASFVSVGRPFFFDDDMRAWKAMMGEGEGEDDGVSRTKELDLAEAEAAVAAADVVEDDGDNDSMPPLEGDDDEGDDDEGAILRTKEFDLAELEVDGNEDDNSTRPMEEENEEDDGVLRTKELDLAEIDDDDSPPPLEDDE